jgi:hypothetical protein
MEGNDNDNPGKANEQQIFLEAKDGKIKSKGKPCILLGLRKVTARGQLQ